METECRVAPSTRDELFRKVDSVVVVAFAAVRFTSAETGRDRGPAPIDDKKSKHYEITASL